MMEAYNVPGLSVAIVKDRKVILCKGFGLANIDKNIPFNENTVGRLASATKFLTGLAVLSMDERGVIDLSAPLGKYLTDIPADWSSVPLWRLMNHTSGLPTGENTPLAKMSEDEQRKLIERSLFEMINKSPLDYKPGERWRYQQTAFATVAMIITEKTGKPWQEIVDQAILQPAGMTETKHTELVKYPADIFPKNYEFEDGKLVNIPYFYVLAQSTGAGYNSNASDLAKLFLALNGNRIVSLKRLKQEVFVKERMQPLKGSSSYSIASEIRPFGKFLTIGHSGGPDIANIRYSPDKKVGVAVLANRSTTGISEDLTNRIFSRLMLDIPFDRQQMSVVYSVRKMAAKSTYDEIVNFFDKAKSDPKMYDFTEVESGFNSLGYALLRESRIGDAIKVFRLNVREFPNSANAYDSLGEAYMKNGNKDLAVLNYKKCLELDPGSENAKKMIEKLQNDQ